MLKTLNMKIYIGCALTFASADFKINIKSFKDILRKQHTILDFIGLENGTSNDVYIHDRDCVLSCDLFIAECSYPSTGLGYEIATAIEHNKKVILIAKKGSIVTRMLLGIPKNLVTFIWYDNIEDIIHYI